MAYTHSKKLLLATSISLVLSGCGGGGVTVTPNAAPSFSTEDFRSSPLDTDAVQTETMRAAVEEDLERIRDSKPRRGSVSQSTNIDTNSKVTKDAFSIEISEDERAPVYAIGYDVDANGTAEDTINIITANNENDEDFTDLADGYDTLVVGGENGKSFDVDGDGADDGKILILAGSNYDGDETDYIAAGLWVYVPDSLNINEVALGAFADGGREFVNIAALSEGTATYRGGAFGLVSINHPAIGLHLADFSTKTFEDVVLNANFGANPNISGTITNLKVGIFNDEGRNLSGTIQLQRANIGGDTGFFTGELSGTIEGVNLQGNWGGQFYGVPDVRPEWVTGTAGGGGRSQEGAEVNFVAAYIAEWE